MTPPAAVRVLLADDETMIRAGVRAVLAADPGIEVVAEAADGRQAVELARAHRPDVALLDIRMPVLDGLAAAAELRAVLPEVAVVMLTTFGEREYVERALGAAGAAGFLLKSADPRELIAGIRAVARGAAYLSPDVARHVIGALGGAAAARDREEAARARLVPLTDRERDVLGLLGAGLSNAEIAAELHLVEGTVKAYVSSLLARLGLRNRVEAAVIAHQAGLRRPGAAG